MWKMSSSNQSLKIASSQQIDKIKNLLTGLGKPTKRGIRKCPSCGTFNGTRGISCKNKACNAVFKEKNFKKERSADAVKLITGTGAQIYSVRLRDKGQDSRGFVELPIIHDNEGQTLNREDVAIDERVIMEAARCYVDNCPRSTGITNGITCVHINAAINCKLFAEALSFKNTVLESLPADDEVKRVIFNLATELPGPIVQRVTKNTMVVKCIATEKHPLGLLHVTFPDLNKKDSKYLCGCKDKKVTNDDKRCTHVLSCICSFLGDDKLNLEFENCIKHVLSSPEACIVVYANEVEKDHQVTLSEETINATEMIDDVSINEQGDDNKTFMIIEDQVIGVTEINQLEEEPVEKKLKTMSDEQDLIQHITHSQRVGELGSEEKSDDSDINRVLVEEDDVTDFQNQSLSSQMSNVVPVRPKPVQLKMPRNAPPRTLTLQTSSLHTASILNEQNLSYYVNKQILPPNSSNLHEDDLQISFLSWLSGVTERINSTMHYQFSGKPDPIVVQVPHVFFEAFQQRISIGKKKRLPNTTCIDSRKESPPIGNFTRFTWHLHNILHVKCIFDTPQVLLEISRCYVEKDGSFIYLNESQKNLEQNSKSKQNKTELKTYLKVGFTESDQKDSTPFIIEWMPDLWPKCKIGEMRLIFEFGHMRNGVIERPTNRRNSKVGVRS